VGGQPGTVAEVDEATFSVELGEPPSAPVGLPATLTLVHVREARYQLLCRLAASHPSQEGAWLLTFEHDEAPARVQQRQYARVRADGIAAIRQLSGPEGQPARGADIAGRLVDVSGGGAQVSSRARLPAGQLVQLSLQVAGERFEAVRAVVLSSDPDKDGHRAHLEFTGRPGAERDRLAAAVTRAELQRVSLDRRGG
jgi:c-di-GMP-binding flagellar brake protein YcgR